MHKLIHLQEDADEFTNDRIDICNSELAVSYYQNERLTSTYYFKMNQTAIHFMNPPSTGNSHYCNFFVPKIFLLNPHVQMVKTSMHTPPGPFRHLLLKKVDKDN